MKNIFKYLTIGLVSLILLISITFNIVFVKTLNNFDNNGNSITKAEFLEYLNKNNQTCELPIIEINTEDEEVPFDKETYINCSFKISNTTNAEYDFEKVMASSPKSDGGVGIRLRGNTTMAAEKKPYRIKFNEKTSVLGLKKNKSWVLLADYYDYTKIKNFSALTLAQNFSNLDWTPTPNHVVLFLNDKFQGLYVFTEQIDENNGRVEVEEDIDINNDTSFPFLAEITLDEPDLIQITGNTCIDIKYPDKDDYADNYTKIQNYITEYVKATFSTLENGEAVNVSFSETPQAFEDLVNVNSLVDYYLINEILSNIDAGVKSTYIHKNKIEKLTFGPIWDFDLQGTDSTEKIYSYSSEWAQLNENTLFKNFLNDENYYNLVASRFDEIKSYVTEHCNFLNEYHNKISNIATLDLMCWRDMQVFYSNIFSESYFGYIYRLKAKCEYLDEVFNKTHQEFLELVNQQVQQN